MGTKTFLTKLEIGQIGFFVGFGSLLGGIISAAVIDLICPSSIVVVSLLMGSIGFYFIPMCRESYYYAFCTLLIGISTSLFISCNNTLLLKSVSRNEKKLRIVQSLKAVTENIGSSFSILLIMFFAAQNYATIFQILGITLLVLGVLAAKIIKKELNVVDVVNPANRLIQNRKGKKSTFFYAISSVFLIGILFAQQRIAYPLFLQERFNSYFTTGLLFWLDPIIVSLFQIKVTHLFSSIKLNMVMAIGAMFLGLGLFLLAIVKTLIGVILAIVVFILGEMLFMPASSVLCFESTDERKKGFSIGSWRIAYSLGLMVGPLISGWLMHHYSFNSCWYLASLIAATVVTISLIISYLNHSDLEQCIP
ncbi:MFS transporter [Legionella clemsonensis]|uniref:MFS transporter n=1 Tax=Legionella clemsonensis TaxID=1867846 RepID=UPI000B8D004A